MAVSGARHGWPDRGELDRCAVGRAHYHQRGVWRADTFQHAELCQGETRSAGIVHRIAKADIFGVLRSSLFVRRLTYLWLG